MNDDALRDHFALMAMAGWLSSYPGNSKHPAEHDGAPAEIARHSYQLADAMMAVRRPAVAEDDGAFSSTLVAENVELRNALRRCGALFQRIADDEGTDLHFHCRAGREMVDKALELVAPVERVAKIERMREILEALADELWAVEELARDRPGPVPDWVPVDASVLRMARALVSPVPVEGGADGKIESGISTALLARTQAAEIERLRAVLREARDFISERHAMIVDSHSRLDADGEPIPGTLDPAADEEIARLQALIHRIDAPMSSQPAASGGADADA